MYKNLIDNQLKNIIWDLGFKTTDTLCSIPENTNFGDYTSNIALQLANQNTLKNKQSSYAIASQIIEKFGHPIFLQRIEIAGPGFLNFYLKDQALQKILLEGQEVSDDKKDKKLQKKLIVEFADPNTHKAFHIGHLRTLSLGESISRLLEYQGNQVLRVNYGSDIGPTVAKALWGVMKKKQEYEAVKSKSLREKAEFLGKAYAHAHLKYEKEESAKQEIEQLNQKIYARDPEITSLWEETKNWSLGYFDTIYLQTGTDFDLRVNESQIDEAGKRIVEENIGKVFVKDQGAIIFPGEKYGLHNRVFITSAGYPTYEGKEIGLVQKYQEVFPFDEIIILSDVQQASFFEVVNKAIELVHPHLLGKKKYLGFGFVSLSSGKMSSRKGNVMTAQELIEQVEAEIKSQYPAQLDSLTIKKIAIASIKFAYLKYSINSDIVFDIKKSISLQGDSGPYLLYTNARIGSVLNRAKDFEAKIRVDLPLSKNNNEQIAQSIKDQKDSLPLGLEEEEREVLRQLEYFGVKVKDAVDRLQPNELANYLLALAKAFNIFYEKYPILASKKQEFRLQVTKNVGKYLKLGLYLLGIETVEKM